MTEEIQGKPQDNRCPDRESNWTRAEFKTAVLPLGPTYPIVFFIGNAVCASRCVRRNVTDWPDGRDSVLLILPSPIRDFGDVRNIIL
jgi:hypothetical protein